MRAALSDTERGTCSVCGCQDHTPCMTDDGPCSWANEEHTLCTVCVGKNEEEKI